jgi:hypothetical protein
MTKVEEIKAAIDKLSFQERCEVNAFPNPRPHDDWDKQMRADTEVSGKLHKLMVEAETEVRGGKLRDLPKRQRK